MPVSSLKQHARRACIRNIKRLESIGECPVHLVETIVNKIEDPEQLRRLEINSPQVVGRTKEAWLNMLRRDVSRLEQRMPSEDWKDTLFAPDKADRWWKVYQKLKRDSDKEKEEETGKLAAQLFGIKRQQEEQLSQVTARRAPVSARGWRTATTSNARTSGQDFFSKMNRNAVAKSTRTKPTHQLRAIADKRPVKAPIALVEDLRWEREQRAQAQLAKQRDDAMRAQGNSGHPAKPEAGSDKIKDREARLKRLKGGAISPEASGPEVTKLTADFLEDSGDEDDMVDDDDLFGITTPRQRNAVNHNAARVSPARPTPVTKSPNKPVVKRRREAPSLFAKAGR